MGADHDILQRTHVHADLQVLESTSHAALGQFVGGFALNDLAIQPDFPSRWRVDPGNQVEQGCLAGPVRTNDRINDPLVDGKADILYRLDAAKMNGQILDFKQCHLTLPCQISPPASARCPWAGKS